MATPLEARGFDLDVPSGTPSRLAPALGRLARGLLYFLVLLWVVYSLAFTLVYAMPSDPVSLMIERRSSGAGSLSTEQVAALHQQYGTDRPLIERYISTLGSLLIGDLGISFQSGQSVSSLIAAAAPATLELASAGLVLAVMISVGLAFLTSWKPEGLVHKALQSVPAIIAGIPAFWLGLLLLQVFSFNFGWFPSTRTDGVSSLILPALALALPLSAPLTVVLVRNIDAAWHSDFVLLLIGRGLPRHVVFFSHVVRNSLLPFVTLLGLTVGGVLVGTVVTETVFSRSGLGRLLVTAVENQDAPVVLALSMLGALVFASANLIVDLVYPFVDPRIRRSS